MDIKKARALYRKLPDGQPQEIKVLEIKARGRSVKVTKATKGHADLKLLSQSNKDPTLESPISNPTFRGLGITPRLMHHGPRYS